MYVAVGTNGFMHQLIQVAKCTFDELPNKKWRAVPVYYMVFEGETRFWPLPADDVVICRLVPVEVEQ